MNLAKVSANGQVTVPIEIRKKLQIKDGDKLLFIERDNEIMISNASSIAIIQAQDAFKGTAKDFGVKTENDVQRLINRLRYGKKK
ncbi:MAG: AbrB/MazE/SpoVT family DNA-binding domain-containing protein [Candidatus Margulisbacteria bacterium]|jgi:AbrB family looped-hinge helix DNA binding protein|nr:AbrB/MazE/SpoVT family DNA-binding domain-containing protein [Candidatus Margulisiibacteriota bacterium]